MNPALVDSTLILFNRSKGAEAFFYNYDLAKGKLSKGYLKKGRGPNEAIGAFSFGVYDDHLSVYDITLKNLLFINKYDALKGQNLEFKSIPIKESFYEVVPLDDHSYLVSGKEDSKLKIQKMDFSGNIIDEFGEFGHIPNSMPLQALKDAYHSFFFVSPSKEKLAVSYLYRDIVEFYELKKPYKVKTVQGPSGFELDFKVGERSGYYYMKKRRDMRKTYLAGDVTDNYVYLAYSGKSYAERNDMNYCKSIHVFDWDSNPVKRINLDRRISGLAVSADDQTIYSYDADSGYIVTAKIK